MKYSDKDFEIKRVNGLEVILCMVCNTWKTMKEMAHFPEENHECIVCFDKYQEQAGF